jgi:hypothetical protein
VPIFFCLRCLVGRGGEKGEEGEAHAGGERDSGERAEEARGGVLWGRGIVRRTGVRAHASVRLSSPPYFCLDVACGGLKLLRTQTWRDGGLSFRRGCSQAHSSGNWMWMCCDARWV